MNQKTAPRLASLCVLGSLASLCIRPDEAEEEHREQKKWRGHTHLSEVSPVSCIRAL